MNIDQLKSAWQQEAPAPLQQEDLLQLIQHPTASPVIKMKKSLYDELITGVLIVGILAVVFLTLHNGVYREGAFICIGLGIIYTFYYLFKLQLLRNMNYVSDQVRTSLEKQLRLLERSVRLYLWSSIILTPVLLFYFGWLVFNRAGIRTHLNLQASFSDVLIPFVGIIALLSIGLFFAYKAYINNLYGKHIKDLSALLRQTEL